MATSATSSTKEVFDLLRDDLQAIEREFGQETLSDVHVITEIGEYLRAGGGKRLRPALLLLSAKLFGCKERSPVRLGVVVEIIHTATLVHDDIIDEADKRRGRAAANTKWGNSKCVLAGDWLYMQSFKIAVQERNFRVLDVLTDLTQQMVEGELLQIEKLGKTISEQEHLGPYLSEDGVPVFSLHAAGRDRRGSDPEQEEAVASYGRNLGMAFQIVDDVLDLTASEEVLGKPVASDLREGKATLAVIHALDRCTPEERTQIEKVLHDRAFNGVTHRQILDILERYGSLDAAMSQAAEYAAAAREAICSFPDSEYKRALLWAPDFVVARNS